MTTLQKVIKYLAMAFAISLTISIVSGILSVLGLLGGFFDGSGITENTKAYAVSSDIRSLDVQINAADFTVKQGDAFSVESNLKHLTVEEKNGVLTLKDTKPLSSTYTGAVLTLCVPADTAFETVTITTGAGRLTADRLSADTMKLELGAGEVSIGTLTAATAIDIAGGAGKITVSGGALHNLDLEMGVGQLNLTSALTGECEFDAGVGEANITVLGSKDDYALDIEKGLGSTTVDGVRVPDSTEQGTGRHGIEIHGGVGAIHLKFQ